MSGTTDDDPYPQELLRFIARFDRREYWLAHEELEELWQVDRRDFFKGMIQFAAAFVHVERQNWRGARRLLRTGLGYIEGAPSRCQGFDVGAVRARALEVLERVSMLAEGELRELGDDCFFALEPLFDGEVPEDLVQEERLPYRARRYEEGYRPVKRRGDA